MISDARRRAEIRWIEFSNSFSHQLSTNLDGSSPPSVFVGRTGYPRVRVGPMLPWHNGDTRIYDTPEQWHEKSIDDIARLRLALVRGFRSSNVYDMSDKFTLSLQEMLLCSNPVRSEVLFEKRPVLERVGIDGNDILPPFGPAATLKSFKTCVTSVDKRIEKCYYDSDQSARQAITDLYSNGVNVSSISRILSMGMLGLRKKRKLSPTRWSITASDNIISDNLISKIHEYPSISNLQLKRYSQIGNNYSVILIPSEIWQFEMHEFWQDDNKNTSWSSDHEGPMGLKKYPSITGAYFAARLAVAEYLHQQRKKASVMVIREITPEYFMSLGVWQVREGVRMAARAEPFLAKNVEEVISTAENNIMRQRQIKSSWLYNNVGQQTQITNFFR